MAQEALLQKLEEAASKAKSLEREKNEAIAKIQTLEREAGELRNLISLAESKADEMLNGGSAPDASRGPVTPKAQVTSVPLASKGFEELVEPSVSQLEKPKQRYPRPFSPG
jgi:hypothetical protein